MKIKLLSIFLFISTASSLYAAGPSLRLPAIISDNMVLEQGTQARLRGWAKPKSEVTVAPSWSDAPLTVRTGANGKWELSVATPAASAEAHSITFSSGKETITVGNVLIGEVWLCSGQSNMEFPVAEHRSEYKWQTGMLDAAQQLADASCPQLRLFKVPYHLSPDTPVEDCEGSWELATPETVRHFSAVGYVFGRRLQSELGVPVGLIQAAKGDTHAEAWMKSDLMLGNPFYDDVYSQFGKHVKPLAKPHRIPSGLWNGMISPIVGYTVKGCIWYQGEANAVRADKYEEVFDTLVESWRSEWGLPEMSFYYVQIAPFSRQPAAIREAQLRSWRSGRLKNIGMAVTTDCGDSLDIHPRNKAIPGHRLALWALNRDYGRTDLSCAGPVMRSAKPVGNAMHVTFDYAEGSLKTPLGEALTGFELAGSDGAFHPARGIIRGDTVILTSDEVAAPVDVRYGIGDFFRCNLYNGSGLPASPFRTDNQPLKF